MFVVLQPPPPHFSDTNLLMFVRVFCKTAGQEAAPSQVMGLGVSPYKGLPSTGG